MIDLKYIINKCEINYHYPLSPLYTNKNTNIASSSSHDDSNNNIRNITNHDRIYEEYSLITCDNNIGGGQFTKKCIVAFKRIFNSHLQGECMNGIMTLDAFNKLQQM
jgi:hypothetical protein